MMQELRNRDFPVACLAVLLACVSVCAAQQGTAASISETEIASLQKELAQQKQASSSTRMRRACKSTVRKGAALIDASPAAPNRFRVLAIVLQSQKRLLGLENSDRNRNALYDTCSKLVKAPDAYAALRLEADFLLSEKALTLKKADVKERAKALAALIKRYRDTSGEAKSLMIAAMIAPKLEAFELKQEILNTMSERFAGDPVVIGWRRKNLGISQLDVLFTGTYTRADGVSLTFPIDAMGHTLLMFFWSKNSPDIKTHLAAVKDLNTRFPGQLDIYSFNLDNLPDAGQKMLRKLGLDWTAMHLPGGKHHQAYRAYATMNPIVVRVNPYGHAYVRPTSIRSLIEQMPPEHNLDDARYMAQLQSLFIGDFLVIDADVATKPVRTTGSVPVKTLAAIQACFTPAPLRYRLTHKQALANYTKAEKLCRDAIKQHSKAPDLWRVRNCRIIALLGMWNLAVAPKHLETAVAEARTALTATLPSGANVVPQYCLAKKAIRTGRDRPEAVVSAFIKATARGDGPASAHAAAAVLAMDINSRELHAKYRQILLDTHKGDPTLWPVVSFLRDQNHTFRLFKANYYHNASRARRIVRARLRSNACALDVPADTSGPLKVKLKTLTGETLSLPQATDGKLTLLMFIEPPADPAADFPAAIGGTVIENSRGRKRVVLGGMQKAFELAEQHTRKNIKVIAAFLSDDADRVKALMKKYKWPCQVALVPGGMKNPLVRRLGILWADRTPNVAMLRADGTIAWTYSGLVHPQLKSEGVGELMTVLNRGILSNIYSVELEASIKTLSKGDFQRAVRLFSGPFNPPKYPHPSVWTAPRLYGSAVANMGLKRWDAALTDIDAAIAAHRSVFNRRAPCACQCSADLELTKARILEQLGKHQEAKAARQRAATVTTKHAATRYRSYHEQVHALSTKEGK
jgi:tetratricopeptide (TPR) repeat protein